MSPIIMGTWTSMERVSRLSKVGTWNSGHRTNSVRRGLPPLKERVTPSGAKTSGHLGLL